MSSVAGSRTALCAIVALPLFIAALASDVPAQAGGEFVFKEDLSRHVLVVRGKAESEIDKATGKILMVDNPIHHAGKLDAAGNFIASHVGLRTAQIGFLGYVHHRINLALGPNGAFTEKVYEFRSGMLIEGSLNIAGDFIPVEGSKVTAFKDYRYSPDAVRIYNLPGYFVPKEK